MSGAAGTQRSIHFLDPTRVLISYEMPLNEVILDFYDKLKSRTQGMRRWTMKLLGYRESDLVKLDILLNGEAETRCLLLHIKSARTHADGSWPRK